MKKKAKASDGKSALELVEEAAHLLREAPAGAHLCYYMGSIPFVLALLYFWSDMSRGANAYDHVTASSLELAALFVWMKSWQAVSAAKLRAFLSGAEEPRWTTGRILNLAVLQTAVQPAGLVLRCVALFALIPYGWVRAYYENAVILGDGQTAGIRELNANARRMAALWPWQNHLLIVCLIFFRLVIWLNVVMLMLAVPMLLNIFTGMENPFSQNMLASLNSTFLATSIGIAYLLVNPLTKAVYLLRCFYGESQRSGDDLKLGMRRAVAAAAAAAMLMLACAPMATAATPQPVPVESSSHLKAGELDGSIDRVLKRDEFAWRLPRQAAPVESENFIMRFMDDVGFTIKGWFSSLKKWMTNKLKKLFSRDRHYTPDGGSLDSMKGSLNFVMWGICGLVACLLAWFAWKNKQSFRRRTRLKAQAVTVVPDLNSEDVVASQLPEDEWLKLAREMIEKGELRLAIRALYLATLAHLGLRELISIARHKSNRDYQRELRRRARTQGDLLNAFGESVSIFEGVWYGSHATTGEIIQRFSANIERIKTA